MRRASRRSLLIGCLSVAALGGGWGCSADIPESPDVAEPTQERAGGGVVELRVEGQTLRPVLELASEVAAAWIDLDSGATLGMGPTPTLDIAAVRRVGLRVTADDGVPALDQVLTLNLGFNRDDDYGRLSLPATHEHDPQPVTAVTGLPLLTNLLRFTAARTPLTGLLDVSGLSRLEHVECYGSQIDSVDLAGCGSLIRLCVEDCRLTRLDLRPVRLTLRDLRAAIQRSDDLTFARLDGPMEALYHYCIRDQLVHQPVPHSQLPVVEEYWVWATGQRTCDAPTSPFLTSYLARENAFNRASVDAILIALDDLVTGEPGRVDLSGASPQGPEAAIPSATGADAVENLLARGWRVSTS